MASPRSLCSLLALAALLGCGGGSSAEELIEAPAHGGASGSAGSAGQGQAGDAGQGGDGQAGAAGSAGQGGAGNGPGSAGSAGASGGACVSAPGPGGDSKQQVQVAGGSRQVLVHVPPGYKPDASSPLVLVFHGYLEGASDIENYSQMSAQADARGFVVVYPEGTDQSWNAGLCCGTAPVKGVDDVAFTSAILDHMQQAYCIDPKRVFAAGLSNGGMLSHRLGCELSDRIAALGPVAGTISLGACNPKRPVPLIEFHGTADLVVPYATNGLQGTTSVPATIDGWAQRNGCTGAPKQVYAQGDAVCTERAACKQGAAVRLCTINGGGHQWPGGKEIPLLGKMSTDISASAQMLDFFLAHPMP